MKNSLRSYKEASRTLTLSLLLGWVVSASTYQTDGELGALRSRIEYCCGHVEELSHQLKECKRTLTQEEHNQKKRSVIESLVEKFNADGDWSALSSGLEASLDDGSPARRQLEYLGREETSPLSQAVDAEQVALLRVLLDHGLAANMATAEHERQTMLHLAATHGKLPVARLLLARGADVHARNRYSNTPLVEAAASNHLPLVRLLIGHGADVNGAGAGGRTALHVATLYDHQPIADFLVEAGVDVDARDRWGQTSLHLAAFEGHLPMAELLLQQSADVAARDQDGLTPLHLAVFGGHTEVARRLVEAGADPDAADLSGWTSLHKAAYRGHLPLVQYLVDSGARLQLRNKANNTALNLAVIEDHSDVVEFLSSTGSQAWIIIDPGKD